MAGLIALLGTLIMVTQVMAGIWTSNNFFYKPDEGARGISEKTKFDSGLNRVDTRLGNEKWLNDPAYGGDLQGAVTAIGSNPTVLHIPPGAWPIVSDLTIPANITIKLPRGTVFNITPSKTLTINGGLDAGPYQIFSWTGTGAVVLSSNVDRVHPEWFYSGSGAYTDAFNKAFASMAVGAELFLLPQTYTVGPLTCTKAVRLNSAIGSGSNATGFGAVLAGAGNQTHILKMGGTDNSNWAVGPRITNISIIGGAYTYSDAMLILQYAQYMKMDAVWMSNAIGRAIRFHNVMDSQYNETYFLWCGVDGDCTLYFDDPEGSFWNNNLSFLQCHFEDNKGSIVKTSTNSALDQLHISRSKFERNNYAIGNAINVPAFDLHYTNRFALTNNVFTNFNDAYQTVMVDFVAQNQAALITDNQFTSCNWSIKVGANNYGPIVVKDNLDLYQGVLTLDNSCALGGAVVFEPMYHSGERGRHDLLFLDKRTPFIPIADITGISGVGYMIKDASGVSLGRTGQLAQFVMSNEYKNVGNFSLRQFASYPGDMQVWVRARTDAGTGTIQVQLIGEANYNVDGTRTFGASLEWQRFTINRAHLAVSANWDTNDCGLEIVAGTGTTATITVDGIYIVLLPTSSASVAYGSTVTPNFGLYNNLKIGTLTGAITIANPTQNVSPGQRVSIDLTCDGTGRTITWGTAYKCAKTSITASKRIVIDFLYDGTNYVQVGTAQEL